MVSVASSSAERGGCFYGQQTRRSSRGEGAGLVAPAAAAKEEQLTRHLRTNFIRTNRGARHRLSASPEPAGCGWLCGSARHSATGSSARRLAVPRDPAGRLAAVGWRTCRIAGGAAACWYRMVPDNVKDYRFVRDYPAKTGVKSSQSGNSSH